jgi:hypothetical protein
MCLLAQAADSYPPPDDLATITKPSAGQLFTEREMAETSAALAVLARSTPGSAVARIQQCVRLSSRLGSGADALVVVQVVETRSGYLGIYSLLELQLLCAVADHVPTWQTAEPDSAQVGAVLAALDAICRQVTRVDDLTALDQRRSICLHRHAASHPGADFSATIAGKQFERRKLQLIEAKAPMGQPAQPASATAGPEQF